MQTDTTLTPEYDAELEAFMADGGTLAMLQDISSDTLEQLYSLAFGQYQAGKWEDAHKIFQALCMLDHYQPRYFLGLGACRQAMGEFETAVQSYSFGAMLDLKDPRFPFHAAECRLQQGDLNGAESGFHSAHLLADADPLQADLATSAKVMLEAVAIRRDLQDEPDQQ
ncbi:CesD/SycD/LcrH family type III secretion system chaperone [Aeromonas piscicola]|uniref:AcrH n=1 Tax=Aeromonas hydrophila TaxID=644 RepID=Q699Q9_AERHY|nr:AcrH [Aeromonas hydrophila]OCA60720.1 CesD/SycD/LcrH family type III secretion system chaperone [Aeromonas piscicola]